MTESILLTSTGVLAVIIFYVLFRLINYIYNIVCTLCTVYKIPLSDTHNKTEKNKKKE